MEPADLKRRTKQFGLRVIRLVQAMPRNRTGDVIGRQLLRSGTSVGANYRAACRARTPLEFVSKMHVVLEEADESLYWMEMLTEAGLFEKGRLEALMSEADELVAIVVASINTARRKTRQAKPMRL